MSKTECHMNFSFKTDEQSAQFCRGIVKSMMAFFAISKAEAIERVNQQWHDLELLGSDDLIYHEDESYWAKQIYYEAHSFWWLDENAAKPKTLR